MKNLALLIFGFLVLFPSICSVSTLSDGKLNFINVHNNEKLSVQFLDAAGNVIPGSLDQINYFFRCYQTNKVHEVDVALLKILDQVQDHFGTDKTLFYVSGYRSPEFNEKLRAEGHAVAKFSQHMHGEACDFYLKEVPLEKIRDYAIDLKKGGVGFYPGQFVHLDAAAFRTW